MKKLRKFVLNAAVPARSAGGARLESAADVTAGLKLKKKSVELFAGIDASDAFTAEAAHRAFAGLKRRV